MFNQYFGNYLLKKRLITPEILRTILEEQKNVKVKLGVLALDAGYMNAAQINKIHKLQETKDKKFGELAIEEGYLTDSILMELLNVQKKSNVLLGQVLIEKGYFTFEQYEEVLLQYNEDSGFSAEEIKALKDNDIEKIAELMLKAVPNTESTIYHEYFELFIRNIIRFIDDGVSLGEARKVESLAFEYFVTQKMEGNCNLFTGFAGSESTLARFASIYAEDTCSSMDDLAEDALGEFMNCQNGLFLSNLSNRGIQLELSPTVVKEHGTLKPVHDVFLIPCYLSFGEIYFVLSDNYPLFQ